MQVRTPMTRDVLVAPPQLPLAEAWRIMTRRGIRHIPVTELGSLVGIVSDRDLLLAAHPTQDGDVRFPDAYLRTIMSSCLVTCAPTTSIAEATHLMLKKKVDALPVVSGTRLVGLVTSTDLLSLLLDRAPAHALPFDFHLEDAVLAA